MRTQRSNETCARILNEAEHLLHIHAILCKAPRHSDAGGWPGNGLLQMASASAASTVHNSKIVRTHDLGPLLDEHTDRTFGVADLWRPTKDADVTLTILARPNLVFGKNQLAVADTAVIEF